MNSAVRSAVLVILVYAFLVLLFTFLSLHLSPSDSQIGKFRAKNTIPDHLLILAGSGALLGLLSSLVYRRLDLTIAALIPISVIILDLDHLPSFLGISQPIRPAHSIIFLLVSFALIFALVRRLDLPLAMVSGFFAHSGVDTGLFAPFSPIVFDYYTITDYRWVFLVLAVASSLAAGYYAKRESQKGVARSTEASPELLPANQEVFEAPHFYLIPKRFGQRHTRLFTPEC